MIIFDFDGTLIDSMNLCVTELRNTFRDMNLPVPPEEELKKYNGPTHEETVKILGLKKEVEKEFCKTRRVYQMALRESCQQMYPGVMKMLDVLSACADLFIASNAGQDYIDESLRHWGIGKYFVKALGGDADHTKGQLVGDLVREHRPFRAAMVGDRLTDILAGKENGLCTIAAAYGFGTPLEWQEADKQAYSVEELTDICLQFCGR